jgi:hypothetical protein
VLVLQSDWELSLYTRFSKSELRQCLVQAEIYQYLMGECKPESIVSINTPITHEITILLLINIVSHMLYLVGHGHMVLLTDALR